MAIKNFRQFTEDEGAGVAVNNSGSGNIAGLGVTPPGKPANWGEPSPRKKKRQQDEAVDGPEDIQPLKKATDKNWAQVHGSLAKNMTKDDIYHPEPDYSADTDNELAIWNRTKGLPTHDDWEKNAEKRGFDNRPGWKGHPSVDEDIEVVEQLVAEGLLESTEPTDTFAGAAVFDVDMDKVHNSRFGKNRYHRYSKYVGEDGVGEAIRKHGRDRKNGDIILRDQKTAVMTYLRRKPVM